MSTKLTPALVVAAVLAALIGVLGVLDMKDVPYAGYFSGPKNDIVRIFPDSPAEQAGLRVGDIVQSIGGIAATDTKASSRRLRPAIGESRSFVVERGAEERALDLTYSHQPSRNRALGIAAALIGLCFLFLPLWAHHRAPSNSTLILALFGICFGAAFLTGPYSKSFFLRTLGGAAATAAVVMGFAFLVHYLMQFPRPGAFLAKAWSKKLIYLPAILLALFFIGLAVAQPDATSGLNRFVGLLASLFVVGFFGWAVVGMVLRFRRATSNERAQHGLALMLIGTLLGLLPVTFANLMGAFAPDVQANLPGVQFFFLTLVLIPLCFAIAALRSAKA